MSELESLTSDAMFFDHRKFDLPFEEREHQAPTDDIGLGNGTAGSSPPHQMGGLLTPRPLTG